MDSLCIHSSGEDLIVDKKVFGEDIIGDGARYRGLNTNGVESLERMACKHLHNGSISTGDTHVLRFRSHLPFLSTQMEIEYSIAARNPGIPVKLIS